jgi:riboflavin biosynthesis pyrimidine reductase
VDLVLARQLRGRSSAADGVPRGRQLADRPLIEAFDVLYEQEGLPAYRVPPDVERIYGRIGFPPQVLYANFVSSLDGAVTLGDVKSAGSVISGRNRWDRFLMGLLRACADAVLLGAGTLRATPGHQWTAEHIFPDLADEFASLRADLGRKPRPRLVLVTGTGDIDASHTAVVAGATVITTAAGARNLDGRLPDSCDVVEVGASGRVDMSAALAAMRERGYDVILTEGGPHVTGELVDAGILDELFLTISPVVAGRASEPRLGFVAGAELLPKKELWSRLLSSRRHADFLFLRYSLRTG